MSATALIFGRSMEQETPVSLSRSVVAKAKAEPKLKKAERIEKGSESKLAQAPIVSPALPESVKSVNRENKGLFSRRTKPVAEPTDVELLRAFQSGDERAFAELYTRRKREVYTYCLRMSGGDPDAASDAFQETFIKVYEKADSFRLGVNVMGWLLMIARNTCLNLHRSKRQSETLEDQRALVSSDRSLGTEYRQEQQFLRDMLERAISMLPEEFREPFILREFDGFSYGEIAEMTHTTLATTKVRIYRAKQRMRELLRPYLREDSGDALSQMMIEHDDLNPDSVHYDSEKETVL
jgi:RNA polymerase sigma-70 factor (ECF subfamily)